MMQRRFLVESRKGKQVVVEMDLYEISGSEVKNPHRFSWIAFNAQNPKSNGLLLRR